MFLYVINITKRECINKMFSILVLHTFYVLYTFSVIIILSKKPFFLLAVSVSESTGNQSESIPL